MKEKRKNLLPIIVIIAFTVFMRNCKRELHIKNLFTTYLPLIFCGLLNY